MCVKLSIVSTWLLEWVWGGGAVVLANASTVPYRTRHLEVSFGGTVFKEQALDSRSVPCSGPSFWRL